MVAFIVGIVFISLVQNTKTDLTQIKKYVKMMIYVIML